MNSSKSSKSSSRKGTPRGTTRGRKGSTNPPSSALIYNGPVFTPSDRIQDDRITRVLCVTGPLVSTVGGVIATALTNNPSPSPDFAAYATSYEEYRVLAAEVEYVPNYENFINTGTLLLQSALAYNLSRDFTAIPGSLGNVLSDPSAVLTNSQSRFRIYGNMSGTYDAQWQLTTTPVPTFAFQIYSSGLSASATYGFYTVRIRVQFRSGH